MMFDILVTVDEWLAANRAVALATVVETWGSSPRQAGAKMGVHADTGMIGSVSGGCVEAAVIGEAMDSLEDGKPRLLHFGVSDDSAWDVGLACGGKISVFVEPLERDWWETAARHVREDKAFVTAVLLNGENAGMKAAVNEDGLAYASPALTDERCEPMVRAAADALKAHESRRILIGDLDVFLDVYQPRPRLVIIGGAHAAMALTQMAILLGFRVVLIDPRRAFATSERFPGVEWISHEYPDKALARLGLTDETYIAILTHDPKVDDPALRAVLPSPAPYVGILSSRRTHEKRIERMTAAGMDAALFERIHTPIGLEIGARTPEEIALCILGEIVAVRNGVKV
jgi:xanthine dehydrogenase accessory factor